MASVPRALLGALAGRRDLAIEYQSRMTAIPALGPENGGEGEYARALYLESVLRGLGVPEIARADAPDSRVPSGIRPNIIARVPGASARTVWIMVHMDVVPPGERSQWTSDPWRVVVEGDVIRGRGVQDNQQAITGALLVAGELLTQEITPDLSLGLLFVSDEETGNAYGIEHVLAARPDLFGGEDLFLVPDYGAPDGSWVEVAEKGQLWLKITVEGRQCHASRPQEGKNALTAAAAMILGVADVAARFPETNGLFEPPSSTFVPSRHEENVPNINTLPGRDVFYVDCRLLPGVEHESVLAAFREVFGSVAARHGVGVAVDIAHLAPAAPATSPQSEIARRVLAGIREVYGVEARCIGVGGGTVAAPLRRAGFSAAVWASLPPTAHIADEYTLVSKILGDAQVMATLLFRGDGR